MANRIEPLILESDDYKGWGLVHAQQRRGSLDDDSHEPLWSVFTSSGYRMGKAFASKEEATAYIDRKIAGEGRAKRWP